MKTKLLILSLTLLSGFNVWAHGEDKLGPHGGYIQMPAAFHTEVLPQGKYQLKVYLLDINWKNPSVASSDVKVTWQEKTQTKANCEKQTDFYLCTFNGKVNFNRGELIVEAKREGRVGQPVSYSLPLKVAKAHDMNH